MGWDHENNNRFGVFVRIWAARAKGQLGMAA